MSMSMHRFRTLLKWAIWPNLSTTAPLSVWSISRGPKLILRNLKTFLTGKISVVCYMLIGKTPSRLHTLSKVQSKLTTRFKVLKANGEIPKDLPQPATTLMFSVLRIRSSHQTNLKPPITILRLLTTSYRLQWVKRAVKASTLLVKWSQFSHQPIPTTMLPILSRPDLSLSPESTATSTSSAQWRLSMPRKLLKCKERAARTCSLWELLKALEADRQVPIRRCSKERLERSKLSTLKGLMLSLTSISLTRRCLRSQTGILEIILTLTLLWPTRWEPRFRKEL